MQLVAEAVGGVRAVSCRFIPVSDNNAGRAAGGGPPRVGAPAAFVMDALEQRQLLSCSLSGTVVTCNGTSNGELIRVYQEDGVNFDVLWIKFDAGTPWNYDVSGVTRVDVFASGGDDDVEVGNSDDLSLGDMPVGVPLRIFGGDGNDSIDASDHADWIDGESGGDLVFGHNGADSMFGWRGE